jgi:hypothetical protein
LANERKAVSRSTPARAMIANCIVADSKSRLLAFGDLFRPPPPTRGSAVVTVLSALAFTALPARAPPDTPVTVDSAGEGNASELFAELKVCGTFFVPF